MNRNLIILCAVVGLFLATVNFPNGAIAVLLIVACSVAAISLIRYYAPEDKDYLTNLFLLALLARVGFGFLINYFRLHDFFGGDAVTYDQLGYRLVEIWQGTADLTDPWSKRAMSTSEVGWGMNYLVGIIYFITGRSLLVAQSFCAVIGAATAPMVYFCAQKIFQNQRVAKTAALAVAFFPSFIIWSGQLLKDGLIIFLLVLTMTMVLQLQKKFSLPVLAILIFSMFGVISLRFYIFYMLAAAVAGSFVIGLSTSIKSMTRNLIAVIVVGLSLTYLGVIRNAATGIDRYGSLEAVQQSRQDLATSAESGFGEDVDVSTTEGAIAAVPIGFIYLMLAPFPWQVTNFRQAITLPEVLLWWSMIPLIVYGIWYTLKNRLREAIPILIFSLMLSLVYSIFQGNVGTAYRQRTQIQVFLFIFVGVGWTLFQERRENKKLLRRMERERDFKRMTRVNS
jgi:4-amino-4-deoxy-L-arabinose transferase-like glycosyltransferase